MHPRRRGRAYYFLLLFHGILPKRTTTRSTCLRDAEGETNSFSQYAVTDPCRQPHLESYFTDHLIPKYRGAGEPAVDWSKVRADPFYFLPYGVLSQVLSYLPAASVVALRVASVPVADVTRSEHFWRRLLRREMPWFWELLGLLDRPLPADLGFRRLYFELEARTTPQYGLTGPLLAVANRRRIWAVCEQLAAPYRQRLGQQPLAEAADYSLVEAARVASTIFVPVVAYPIPPAHPVVFAKRLISSPAEVEGRCSVFTTLWNRYGFLVGLGVLSGGSRRVFSRLNGGELDRNDGSITTESVPVMLDDWVKGLILHIWNMDFLFQGYPAGVVGVTVSETGWSPHWLDVELSGSTLISRPCGRLGRL